MSNHIGDTLHLGLNVSVGPQTRYVWEFWDGTILTTIEPSISKVINQTGNLSVTVYAVDAYGQSSVPITIPVVVELSPIVGEIDIPINDRPFPYVASGTIPASDPNGFALSVVWGGDPIIQNEVTFTSNGSYVISGTIVKSGFLSATFVNSAMEKSVALLEFRGTTNEEPTIFDAPDSLNVSVGIGNELSVSATAFDPDGFPLFFSWEFWDGVLDPGVNDYAGNGVTINTVTRLVELETTGTKMLNLVVRDNAFHSVSKTIPVVLS